MAKNSASKIRANAKYTKKTYFTTNVRFHKGNENYIRYIVECSGGSLNSFILDAVYQKINEMIENGEAMSQEEFENSSESEMVMQRSTERKEEYKRDRENTTKEPPIQPDESPVQPTETPNYDRMKEIIAEKKTESTTGASFQDRLKAMKDRNTTPGAIAIQKEKARIWAEEEANSTFRAVHKPTDEEGIQEFIRNNN